MLLSGLAMSLQINVSVGDHWKEHAQKALDREVSEQIEERMTLDCKLSKVVIGGNGGLTQQLAIGKASRDSWKMDISFEWFSYKNWNAGNISSPGRSIQCGNSC